MNSKRWIVIGIIFVISGGFFVSVQKNKNKPIEPQLDIPQINISTEIEKMAASSTDKVEQEVGFELLGTVINHHSDSPRRFRAYAFLEDLHTHAIDSYRLNDELKDWTLVDISLGSVTLLKQGRKVTLTVQPGKDKKEVVIEVSPTEKIIYREPLVEAVKNLNQLWQEVAVIPRIEGGKITDFQVGSIDKGSIINKLGVQKGDIIKEVNNQPVESFQEAARIVQDLRKKPYQNSIVHVKIVRDNKPQTLTYTLY